MNRNEFIEKAVKIHGDKYDYNRVKYKNYGHMPIIYNDNNRIQNDNVSKYFRFVKYIGLSRLLY